MQTIFDISGIDLTKPVQVYRNLHKPGCMFSVRQNGRVLGYVDFIVLTDCRFKHASPKQLAEVRTGARQVCQWIVGTVSPVQHSDAPIHLEWNRVSCDPKTADGFCVAGNRIDHAESVSVSARGCFAR